MSRRRSKNHSKPAAAGAAARGKVRPFVAAARPPARGKAGRIFSAGNKKAVRSYLPEVAEEKFSQELAAFFLAAQPAERAAVQRAVTDIYSIFYSLSQSLLRLAQVDGRPGSALAAADLRQRNGLELGMRQLQLLYAQHIGPFGKPV
jgi:hypothetical protein